MAKDGDGKDTNDKKKPNLALSMLVEVALAIIVQWKSITECFNTCNSRVELFEKIAYIVLITIGISKPAELIHNLFMKLVDSVWVVITGHPLTPELNPDMEHWFKVVFSFLIQYGFAALWEHAKYISACLDSGNCYGFYGEGEFYMDLTAKICGGKGMETDTCHYIFNHMPIALAILVVFAGSVWALKLLIDESYSPPPPPPPPTKPGEPKPKLPNPNDSKSPKKNQMVDAFCPHCKKNSRVPVPHALLVVYCKNC